MSPIMKKQSQFSKILLLLITMTFHIPLFGEVKNDSNQIMSDNDMVEWFMNNRSDNIRTSAPLFLKMAMSFYRIDGHDELGFENKGRMYLKFGKIYLDKEVDSIGAITFFNTVEPLLSSYPAVRDSLLKKVEFIRNQTVDGDFLPFDPVLIDRDGNKIRMTSVLTGRIVYTDLWSTSCIPCCRELPHMKKLSDHYSVHDCGITCLSISLDDSFNKWKNFIERNGLDWPQYMIDENDADRFLSHFRIMGIPRFLVISNDGHVLSVNAPRPSDNEIQNYLERIANKPIN